VPDHAQEATAGGGAELERGFLAQDVYLVLGGTGTLDVSVNGHHTQTLDVAGIPRLYTLYQAGSATSGTLLLHASPGVQAYDFTILAKLGLRDRAQAVVTAYESGLVTPGT
jgi:hypothetical protein